jgi:predicted ribosome quality control (RQC) complex YloA/Tae2 family protein
MNVLLLRAWLAEQGPGLIGARLRDVQQCDERSVILELHGDEGVRLLLLSVLEEQPTLAVLDEMPEVAGVLEGNFAKALRFHLAGYQLVSIVQEGFDRSVLFGWATRDTYDQETQKTLRHELVGRASNAFLLSDRGMVVSIMKRVRREQNRVRQVITGKPLPPPPPLGKYVAAEHGPEGLTDELSAALGQEAAADQAGLEHLFVQRVAGVDVKLWPALEPLLPIEHDIDTLCQFIQQLQRGDFSAQLFGFGREGSSANDVALELWRQARSRRRLGRPAGAAHTQLATTLDQLHEQRRLAAHADEIESLALELLRGPAEFAEPGEARHALNRWQEAHPEWAAQIRLDRSVQENGQHLLHYAQRLRRGLPKLDSAIAQAQAELERAETAPAAAHRAPRPMSHPALRSDARARARPGARHLRFASSDGMAIVCGVSDASNDALLRAYGASQHLWLHARDYPGSHVIVLCGGSPVPRRTLEEAAIIAAHHSQGRDEAELDVSYVPMKHIRRPKGGKPGQVLKVSEKVIRVQPSRFEELKGRLTQGTS